MAIFFGAIVSSTSYDSFGNATSNIATTYRYTGREYDPETGLYYYRNRWYDPETGRFTSKDPIGFAGGDINLYGYVGSNPLSFIDPFGFRGCPPRSSWGWDAVQGALDVAGLAPGVGIVADLTNAGISVARGNYADATLSMAAAVPIVGAVAGAGKLAHRLNKVTKSAGQLGREGEAAASVITGVGKNTQKFSVNGRNRIPDQVNASNINTRNPLIVTEVKNVKSQSFTRQLRDNVKLVGPGGRVDVFVRANTKLSGPLRKAHADPRNPINIRPEL